jgi:hypothetical protein
VYRPVALMVPAVELPPDVPSTDHVTAVLFVPVTVSLNCCCADADKVAVVGLIATLTGGGAEEVGAGCLGVALQPTKGRTNANRTQRFNEEDSVAIRGLGQPFWRGAPIPTK